MRISTSDLNGALANLRAAAEAAGFDVSDSWHLQTGSPTYGRAYRLHGVHSDNGGHYALPFMTSDGYLGDTRRDAWLTMIAIGRAIRGTAGLHDPSVA